MNNTDYKNLMKIALEYREKAYVPYSKFKVGAAVLFESGEIYGGCNIENASFGATNCAERTAIFKGVSEGETKIKAIAEVGSLEEVTYPCGICRQVLCEFGDEDMVVILGKSEDDYIVTDLKSLMPGAFRKENIR
ncbi:MAG: cytidine deaminase [Clostridium butyricum]|nr:cytidine deaminase [Clostridium butyricum]